MGKKWRGKYLFNKQFKLKKGFFEQRKSANGNRKNFNFKQLK